MTKRFKLPRKAKKRYKKACITEGKKDYQYRRFSEIYMNQNDYDCYLETGNPLPF